MKTRLAIVFFVAALLFHAAIFLTHAWATCNSPYQLDFGEGAVLCLAEILHRHEPIYRALDQPPFLAGVYAPIFLWLSSLLLGPTPSFAGGRLLAELSTVLFALSVGGWLWRRNCWQLGIVGMTFYLANPVVLGWNCLDRVDALGLLFSLWGVLLIAEPRIPVRLKPTDVLATLCFTLAFFDKQTFVAGPVSAFVALLLVNRALALRFALLQGGLVAVGLAVGYLVTGGQFLTLLFFTNAMPFHPDQLLSYLSNYALFAVPLLVLAWRGAEHKPSVLKIYALVSLWTVFGSGRYGADYNYFLELHGALALLGALALKDGSWESALGLLTVLVLGIFFRLGPTFYSAKDYLQAEAFPLWSGRLPAHMQRDRAAAQKLEVVLNLHPGPMISENMGNALLNGRIPWLSDPSTFMGMINRGLWDQEQILKPLREGRIKVVTLQQLEHNPRFSPEFLRTVIENYQEVGQFGVDHVFVARAP